MHPCEAAYFTAFTAEIRLHLHPKIKSDCKHDFLNYYFFLIWQRKQNEICFFAYINNFFNQ